MDIMEFATEAEARRYRAAVQKALGKSYPIPGRRNGKTLPPGRGETVEYVEVLSDGRGFAVPVTSDMVPLDGRVERVEGRDVTVLTSTRREVEEGETWERKETTPKPVGVTRD